MKPGVFARLTRIEHAILLCAAVLVGEVIVLRQFPTLEFMLLSFFPPFFIELSAFAINDFFDVEVDRKNGRGDRPLVTGEATMDEALAASILCFLIGIAAAWLINPVCFLIALAFGALAFLYSFKLKDMALLGNIYIAFTMAIPFIFGNMAVSGILSPSVVVLALIAFIAGLGREVMGTVRDMEGDQLRRAARTLPMVVGTQSALLYASFLYVFAVLMSAIPFIAIPQYKNDLNFLVFIGFCDALLLYIAVRAPSYSKQFLEQARKISLAAMASALLGFLIGALY